MRHILEDSINRILTDHITPELLRQAESGIWSGELWHLIESCDFPLALVSEGNGGSAMTWSDVYPLIVAAGKHALPLPLPEMMLACWLLDLAGIRMPTGAITIAESIDASPLQAKRSDGVWRLHGRLSHVPWSRSVPYCVAEVIADGVPQLALVPLAEIETSPDLNLAREPRDVLVLDGIVATAVAPLPASMVGNPVRLYGAMLRSAQASGAIERLVEQCVAYALERVQFGRAIGKFQAIQQQIAILGCESAACATGSAYAFEQAATAQAEMAIATAKVRTSEAAGKAASIAHAVHGAIGFTYEHSLHFSTRRLWSWRSEFGTHSWWSQRIGQAVCRNGGALWPMITEGRLKLEPDTARTRNVSR
jgi:acyl-CoA dehydrogenase